MIGFAKVYDSNWKKLSKFCSKPALCLSGKTLCSWSDRTLSHLVVQIKPLNIKGQAIKICYKENKLYVNGKYTAISRDFFMTSILT